MTQKTKHKWIGWGYETSATIVEFLTICEHCRIDVYNPYNTRTEYCEDYPAERAAWEESERTKPVRTEEALNKVRLVLTEEEYTLLNLRYFGEYHPRDYIRV